MPTSSDGPEVKRLDKVIIPQFQKTHPGIVVKDVPIPYDSLHQKLVTGVAGGQLPDLVRLRHHLGPRAREPRRARAPRQDVARLQEALVDGLRGPAGDELLEGSLLRASARHEHADVELQHHCARRCRSEWAAEDVRRAEDRCRDCQGEGALPLCRERDERLEPPAVDLVGGRQPDKPHLHQGVRLSERAEERGRHSDAR